MDAGRHGDFTPDEATVTARTERDTASERGTTTERDATERPRTRRTATRARRAPKADAEPAPARARPFHYATQRCLTVGQVARWLPAAATCALSAGALRFPVVAVRLAAQSGSPVHVCPTLTADALYLDHRDLAALEAGAIVPDLAETVARIR